MTKIPLYQIDAFTEKLFGGNPASVVPLQAWLPDGVLQQIAQENNQAETAFLVAEEKGYRLRWFSPEAEVDLCGHATLAAAYTVFHHLLPDSQKVRFDTHSGPLYASHNEGLITIDLPATPAVAVPAPQPLLRGLGLVQAPVFQNRDYLVVVESEEDVQLLKPNFEELDKLDVLGVIVTARGKRADFVSRFFLPNSIAREDNVTGSAHCTLAPYWAPVLGKQALHAVQLSKRGGDLLVKVVGDRVHLSGKAVCYAQGHIFLS